MAVRIVDLLEVVGVEQQESAPGGFRFQPFAGDLQEVATVERACQVVGGCAQLGVGASTLEVAVILLHRLHAAPQVVLQAATIRHVRDNPAHLVSAVGKRATGGTVVDPSGHAIGADQTVQDFAVTTLAQPAIELVIGSSVIRMHRRIPVHHLRIRLRPTQKPVSARALEQLLEAAVRVGKREVHVCADHVQEAREPAIRLRQPRRGLLAHRDVRDDAVDQHAAVALRARACARSRNTLVMPSTPTIRYVTSASSPASRRRLNASYAARSSETMRDSQYPPISTPSGTGPPSRLAGLAPEAWWT